MAEQQGPLQPIWPILFSHFQVWAADTPKDPNLCGSAPQHCWICRSTFLQFVARVCFTACPWEHSFCSQRCRPLCRYVWSTYGVYAALFNSTHPACATSNVAPERPGHHGPASSSSHEGAASSSEANGTPGASARQGQGAGQQNPRLAQLYAPTLAYVPVSLVSRFGR